MYSPKGSAFIHVPQNATSKSGILLHKQLQPTTTCTDLATDGTLAGRFNYVGALCNIFHLAHGAASRPRMCRNLFLRFLPHTCSPSVLPELLATWCKLTIGTRDYTAYCAVNDAFTFRETELGGHDAIMTYISNLARRGGELLSKMWRTFTLVPPSMQPGMTNPVLPCKTSASCSYLTTNLSNVSDVWLSGDQLPSPGQRPSQWCTSKKGLMVYWRLSAQVYLEISDFERLGKAVLERMYHPEFRRLDTTADEHAGTTLGTPVNSAARRDRADFITEGLVDERVVHAREFNSY